MVPWLFWRVQRPFSATGQTSPQAGPAVCDGGGGRSERTWRRPVMALGDAVVADLVMGYVVHASASMEYIKD